MAVRGEPVADRDGIAAITRLDIKVDERIGANVDHIALAINIGFATEDDAAVGNFKVGTGRQGIGFGAAPDIKDDSRIVAKGVIVRPEKRPLQLVGGRAVADVEGCRCRRISLNGDQVCADIVGPVESGLCIKSGCDHNRVWIALFEIDTEVGRTIDRGVVDQTGVNDELITRRGIKDTPGGDPGGVINYNSRHWRSPSLCRV